MTMRREVTFVELSVYERITPLASGYLQAYASTEAGIRGSYEFGQYTASVKTPRDQILGELLAKDSDVYAFSCYVWNMGLVKGILPALIEAKPGAQVILGGPQVMHHGHKYLDRTRENLVLCNGEGEVTFTEYLKELTQSKPDLSRVQGLSLYRDGQLVETAERARIQNLDEIPSPFLTDNIIEPQRYSMSILETNRGCPFRCGFCFWGAATNDRVFKFDEDRVREEITWMAKNGIVFLYIADANWGMLKRDIELSGHIADCAAKYRLPHIIYFSAAKNKPTHVTQITQIFKEAGLVTSQPVSMQTIDPTTLDMIQRSNIKLDAFAAVQKDLRDKHISSFIELIWPLPGETLTSLKRGVDTLCDNDADTIIIYSHLLLNNTPLYQNREQYGFVTRPGGGGIAEAHIVVETAQVTWEDFKEGMRFFYALHALQNTRTLRSVRRYLAKSGQVGHADFFTALVDYWRAIPDDPLVRWVEASIETADFYDVTNYGAFIHMVAHSDRDRFNEQLRDFSQKQSWWADPKARALFEIDLVNRPYLYSNTPLDQPSYPFQSLQIVEQKQRGYVVEVDDEWIDALLESVKLAEEGAEAAPSNVFYVDHRRLQYPYMATQTIEHHGGYCHGMVERIENVTPTWTSI
jgi:tRNA A37 methylthiotransferase MiaB